MKQNKNIRCHSRMSLSGISALLNNKKAVEVPDYNLRGRQYNKAFTLIELLVVVLIIGILSAVALPQYQKAVEKSRATQAVVMLKSVYYAAENYYLANGTWPTQFSDLEIAPPWTGNTKWETGGAKDTRSDKDWSIQLISHDPDHMIGIGRISGPYKGTGFVIYKAERSGVVPIGQIVCMERQNNGMTFDQEPGSYCQKIVGSNQVLQDGPSGTNRYYSFM